MRTIIAVIFFVLSVPAVAAEPCVIVGDSIAQGLPMKECTKNAKGGIPSGSIIAMVPDGATGFVIVSAGSNDPKNKKLRTNLEAIRAKAPEAQYIWILPISGRPRLAVAVVAGEHHDRTVAFAPAKDRVHPKSYGPLVRAIRAAMK